MLSFPGHRKNAREMFEGATRRQGKRHTCATPASSRAGSGSTMTRTARDLCGVRIGHAPVAGEVVRFAARELAAGPGAMLGEAVGVEAVAGLDARSLLIEGEAAARSAATSPSTA